jgi:hypothetical protein
LTVNKSDSIANLAAALVKVQAKIRPLKRNADNPFFKSNYTDLAAMAESLYPLLSAEGLAVVQGGFGDALSTILVHASGEWIESSLPMPNEPNPQKLGSVITYFRRYALAAIVGAASEGEDDDGNAASHPPARASAPPPANRPPAESGARPTPPAPAARATGAGPASPGDALEVTEFKESEGVSKTGSPWKRFTATFNNGTRASTFDTKHGAMLKEAHEKGEPVIVTFQVDGKFTNIISVEEFPF